MDLLEDLKADHARFLTALDRIGAIRARDATSFLNRLSTQMRSHRDRERDRLFPALRGRAPASAPLLDALTREHSRLEQLLTQARAFVPSPARRSDHRFVPAFHAFAAALRAQIAREEAEVFPLARANFTRGELAAFAEEERRGFPVSVELGGSD